MAHKKTENKELLVALLPKKSALDILKDEGGIMSLWKPRPNAGLPKYWHFIRAKYLERKKHTKFVTSGK